MNKKNIETVLKILRINEEFILEFENLIAKIKKHKRNCNIAKSVGVGVAAVGTGLSIAGIAVATIATGGVALLVAAPILGWGGMGIGVAGGLTSGGTEIADTVVSSKVQKKIEGLRQRLKIELDKAPDLVGNILRLKEAESSMSGRLINTGVTMVNNAKTAWTVMNDIGMAARLTSNGGSLLATVGQNASVGKIVCTFVTKSPLVRITVVSLIVTGVELGFLYKSWKKPHELEKVVQDLIQKIRDINHTLRWFIDNHSSNDDLPDLSQLELTFETKQY